MQYSFDCREDPVDIKPHGNSKGVSENTWFHVFTDIKKQQHMRKVFAQMPILQCPLDNLGVSHGTEQLSSSEGLSRSSLSVPVSSIEVEGVARSTLENIWKKAEVLVREGHVVSVPWSVDKGERFVKSSSNVLPH